MNVFHAFPALLDRLDVPRTHLVHVGAHQGQEMIYYRAAGIGRITLVEPQPILAAYLCEQFGGQQGVTVEPVACADRAGTATLRVLRRTNMATLLRPAPGDRVHDSIEVEVRRLADIAPDATIAVVDAQGLELEVLRGAALESSSLQLLIVETCTVPDPAMASGHDEVVAHLARYGFTEVDRWVRDYQFVHQWARGRRTGRRGEIRDVAFVRR